VNENFELIDEAGEAEDDVAQPQAPLFKLIEIDNFSVWFSDEIQKEALQLLFVASVEGVLPI